MKYMFYQTGKSFQQQKKAADKKPAKDAYVGAKKLTESMCRCTWI